MTGRTGIAIAALTVALALLAGCGNANNAAQNVPPAQPTTAVSTPLPAGPTAALLPTTAATATSVATAPAATAESTSTELATTAATAVSTSTEAATTAGTPGATETETGFEPPHCVKADCTANGEAITSNLKGDPASGEKIFAANCAVCHGQNGKGGVANPGSEDGTVPSLNPVDEMFTTSDPAEFAKQLDLFIEHGSHTDGVQQMPNWGDAGTLSPQQIADVIAYIMSLNPH